ncbi:MAG: DUF2630 family protein [Acidimicrobiales bacterium]
MDDEEILKRIRKMVDEEHGLRRSGEMVDDSRMRQLEETLDQCWDLLRQRRAHREFGAYADDSQARDIATVEHYEQ